MVLGVLMKAGAVVRARVVLYKALVQAFLMYRSEILVVTYATTKVL